MNHTHPFTSSGHQHTLVPGTGIGPGPHLSSLTQGASPSGNSGNNSAPLPYYSLAYIMCTG